MKQVSRALSRAFVEGNALQTRRFMAAASALVIGTFAAPGWAQDPPTGGVIGCKSEGNCQGTVYKDPRNLDRWWYKRCSGCHVATVAEPTEAVKEPAPELRTVFSDPTRFWRLHGQAQSDPVLKRLLPKERLKPARAIAPEFQVLMQRR